MHVRGLVGQNVPAAKRPASEELNTSPDTKKIKGSDGETTEPVAQRPTTDRRVPIFERVRQDLCTSRTILTIKKTAVIEERNGEIQFRVINNDGSRQSTIILTGLKNLFQKQLPKMPKDYIARLVYDRNHTSLALVKMPLEVVSSDQQVKGYGAHLMAHLKDYVRASSPSVWMGFIKDYEGGTLMQCSMLPRIRYLEASRMLLKQKETVQAKIRSLSKSHVIHAPPQKWANGDLTPINSNSIPAIRATGWSPSIDTLARKPPCPFLKPVNKDEVSGYYNVITSLMDLTTIEERLEKRDYDTLRDFINNLKLIFNNCWKYKDALTVYAKCAVKLEKYMWTLVEEIPKWYKRLMQF
ncbi:GCN5-related histone actyltransferase [Bimuria novae-zelandiae CBS 107.79]|uniref:GCN5-related histone actyltransferase n=1 Tax=Bimuria novae-zelandiae CBS 107.79 TaxID=1447943 RepID=A0A6A5V7E2_9PLEO|nr:GCN5-related histone actyltransferase [Bimuria novae-zelandiae CBS 107.79]